MGRAFQMASAVAFSFNTAVAETFPAVMRILRIENLLGNEVPKVQNEG
jgi:hypothetical protein